MSAANAPTQTVSLEEARRAHEPSMEEILASIRRIIADDDRLPPMRRDRAPPRPEPEPVAEPEPAPEIHYHPAAERREQWAPEPASAPRAVAAAKAAEPAPQIIEPAPQPPASQRMPEPRHAEPIVETPAPARDQAELDERLEAALEQVRQASAVMPRPALPHVAYVEEAPHREPVERAPEAAAFEAAFEQEAHESFAIEEYYDPHSEALEAAPAGHAPSLVSSDAAASIGAHFQALAATTIINDSGVLQEYAKEMLRPMLKQWLDDNLPVMVEKLVRAEIERVARGRR